MGVVIDDGGTAPPAPPSSNTGGTSASSSASRTTSTTKSSNNKNQAYIQMYRLLFGGNVKPNMDLIKKAVSGNWSGAYFKMQVRLNDPRYFKSQEAKERAADFNQYWKAVFPGAQVSKSMLKNYLRSSWSKQQLQDKVMQTKRFQREYKHYNAFANAQRQAGNARVVDPLAYRQYQDAFRSAYEQAGMPVPTGFEKAYFKSGISDDEFRQNFLFAAQTQNAGQWDIGGTTQRQQKNVLFNGKGSDAVRSQLQQALQKQQRFFQQQSAGFANQLQGDLPVIKGI